MIPRIWLGEPGNEVELPALGRTFTVEDIEIVREDRMASGRLVWDVVAVKKVFTLSYSLVDGPTVSILADLYSLHKPLSLKVEQENGSIRTYTVRFRPFRRSRYLTRGVWLWSDLEIQLEEV